MLYAQTKERDNRFKLALRTILPSFLFAITLFVLFFEEEHFVLFFSFMLVLSFIFTYYNLHIIYNGFNRNIIDPETLVLNYKAFKTISEKVLKKKKPSTFLMIKLGDLEEINAHYGREQTNITLKQAIDTLLKEIDAKGFKNVPAASFGGGIFVLCFAYSYAKVLHDMKILFKDKKECYINDIEMDIDFALVDAEGEKSADIIFGHLHDLIHQSNQEEFPFEDAFNKERIIEKRIKEALSSKSLSLQYQEVHSVDTKSKFLEFSSKLIDNQHKLIHHSDISLVINRIGLEKSYYLLIIESIFKTIKEQKIDEDFAINITAFAFRHKELIRELFVLLKSYQIRPSQMMLVINESRYYKHVKRYKEIVDAYRQEGVLVCFANVGSVNPMLEYLKHMNVDMIRYDKSLAKESEDAKVLMVYEALQMMAQNRGIKTWAAMIEDKAVQSRVTALGVNYIQGRHIAILQSIEALHTHKKDIK